MQISLRFLTAPPQPSKKRNLRGTSIAIVAVGVEMKEPDIESSPLIDAEGASFPNAQLPPIVERLPEGEEGAREFHNLVDLLWRAKYAAEGQKFNHRIPLSRAVTSRIGVAVNYADYEGMVDYRAPWLPSDIPLPQASRLIAREFAQPIVSLSQADTPPRNHKLVIIFPRDLHSDELEWLRAQPKWEGYTTVEIWGMSHLAKLLRPVPALFARYYPERAAGHLPGFVPFDFRAFAHSYCDRIVLDKQYVHLLGFPPDTLREKDAKAHIHCADLFVPTVFRKQKATDERTALAELLTNERSVLVLGDPGMGKTMLLTFLALLHANGAAQLPDYAPPRKRIPLFVSLREYALEDQTRDLSLLDFLAKQYARFPELQHAHPAFFEASLRMGEAIVLLDGLDEVGSSAARKRMADRVRELRRDFPDCPIWVTSRIHGYTHDIALPDDEFDHVRIGPLEDAQVDDFLARWYTIQVPDDPEKRAEHKQSLREAIFRTKQVRALATNPLLLTLMAFVHRFLGHLPQDRGELYEQCVTMLLRNWLEARQRPEKHAFEDLGLAAELPRGYLEALAFYVQEQPMRVDDDNSDARGLFAKDDALAFLTTLHIENDRRDPPISPLKAREEMREFLDYACDRVGLLVDRGAGKLSFLHLSFQEYLAAAFGTVMATIRDQERVFLDHCCDPGWSEVLLLRLYLFARKRGRAGLAMFDELIRVLLDELGRRDDLTGWLLLGRALRDRQDVRQSQRRVILERLVRAWAVELELEGEVFVTLEDIRIFATDGVREELRAACAQVQATGRPAESIAALHLEEKLFGGVEGAAKRFAARADLDAVLADLVALHDVPEIAALLAEKSTPDHWETAFAAVDANDVHRLTLGWATGAILCCVRSDAPLLGATRWLRRKINAEVESREKFAAKYHDHHNATLFERPGTLRLTGEFRHAEIPLAYATVKPLHIPLPARDPATQVNRARLLSLRWRGQMAAEIMRVHQTHTQWMSQWVDALGKSLPVPNEMASHQFSQVFTDEFILRFVKLLPHWMGTPHQHAWERAIGNADFKRGLVVSSGRSFATNSLCALVERPLRRQVDAIGHDLGPEFSLRLMTALKLDVSHFDTGLIHRSLWKTEPHRRELLAVQTLPLHRFTFGLESKSVIPRLLADLCVLLGTNWMLCLGRYLHVLYPDGYFPFEAWDDWLAKNPLWSVWSALAWNEHAKLYQQTHGKLDGSLGALMLAHADYASLMTGLDLEDYPIWKSLVEAAGPTQIDKLRHFVSASASAAAPEPAPAPAEKPVIAAEPAPLFTYLHLSDMHFGLPAAGDRHNQSIVLAALRDEFAALKSKSLPRPDAIFITGDIAWAGKSADYEVASKWLDDVLNILGLTDDRVFVVPGNHDTDRSATNDRLSKLLLGALRDGSENLDEVLEDEASLAVLLKRKAAYLDFAQRFAPACHAPDKPALQRLAWTHREQARGMAVNIVGFDTALLAAGDDDAKKLRIGQAQFALLKDCDPNLDFVVVLGHHPFNKEWLYPDEEREAATHVRRRAHVYLAGHVHEHDSAHIISGGGNEIVHVVAGALYGGRKEHIPHGHAYSIGVVLPPFAGKPVRLRIHPRRFSFKHGDFRTDTDNVPEGKTYADFDLPRLRM